MIVDAQVHFWKANTPDRPWLPNRVAQLPEPFTEDKFDRRLFDAFGPRRCYWGTDLTNSYAKATYKQRVTHFTETLDFLSAQDKEWVMGRAILERLGWK
jgi:hypothetical protein